MKKRTKRYGGFLVGDRVRVKVKGKYYEYLKEGEVKALTRGYCLVYFKEQSEMLSAPVYHYFMPNQLINLTRQDEEEERELLRSDDPQEPTHYDMPITPIEFIEKNNLGFSVGNVIKYVCRYKNKNGKEDLLKARKYIDLLIEKDYGKE